MKILMIGSGGREHALIKKLLESPKCEKLYCAPGNGGISRDAELVNINVMDKDGMVKFAKENAIDLVFVAPDDPLADGMVDALQAACEQQGTELRCLVEYDIGMNRCGVKTKEEVSSLARHLLYAPNLIFEGIQAYAGNLAHEEDTVLRKRESEAVEEKVRELKNYLEDQGISVKEVSGISTGTIDFHGKDSVYTEAQCGSYLFSDTSYRKVGVSFRNALSVLATVVSARPGAIVTDAGVKSLAMDQRPPVFAAAPELSVNFSEEHSAVYGDVPAKKPGDIIRIIPGHCCTTVNLYDWIYLVRDGQIVDRLPVTGRGRSQ